MATSFCKQACLNKVYKKQRNSEEYLKLNKDLIESRKYDFDI